MIEESIFDALRLHAGTAALVGTRIHPVWIPQNPTYPAVSWLRVSTATTANNQGSGRENLRIQVDCWAATYLGARQLAAQVKAAMEAATAFSALLLSDSDVYEEETHRASLDFSIW